MNILGLALAIAFIILISCYSDTPVRFDKTHTRTKSVQKSAEKQVNERAMHTVTMESS